MARRDKIHYQAKQALENDGWQVTDDPYILKLPTENGKYKQYPIDLGAEKIIAAQKGKEKIAVEVKTFGSSSIINDFHKALGQYMDYLAGLEVQEPARVLFLMVTEETYEEILQQPLAKLSLNRYKIRVIIFDATSNLIVKWIK